MIYKDLRRIDTVSVRYYYGGFYPFLLNNNGEQYSEGIYIYFNY